MVYCYIIFGNLMSVKQNGEEIRWQVIKAMLDEFPTLKEKTKKYLKKRNPK